MSRQNEAGPSSCAAHKRQASESRWRIGGPMQPGANKLAPTLLDLWMIMDGMREETANLLVN